MHHLLQLWFWSQHLKCQSKLNRPGRAVRFSIGSQTSSPISEAIIASSIKNIKFEIRNNTLDQLQGMSAKMAARANHLLQWINFCRSKNRLSDKFLQVHLQECTAVALFIELPLARSYYFRAQLEELRIKQERHEMLSKNRPYRDMKKDVGEASGERRRVLIHERKTIPYKHRQSTRNFGVSFSVSLFINFARNMCSLQIFSVLDLLFVW